MDQERFDEITKALASGASRRQWLRRVGLGLAGALGIGTSTGLAAPPDGKGGQPQGRCATACPDATVCQGGTCVCPVAGETYIGGVCYDLANDPLNCGGVGEVCTGD